MFSKEVMYITNDERIQARIARSKEKRAKKRMGENKQYDNSGCVFTTQKYVGALRKCNIGVMWKRSVQSYNMHPITNINTTFHDIHARKVSKLKSTKEITIYERGKKRIITPVVINDRMTQRVLCDNALVPVLRKTLIYDNGASLPGKGVEFTRKRFNKMLASAVKEYGGKFYALTFDFKGFFDSILHATCLNVLNHNFRDKIIVDTTMAIIRSYYEPKIRKIQNKDLQQDELKKLQSGQYCGICLGSQVSQIMALSVPNRLDHYIKDQSGVRYYIRYMDDGIILSDNKETLRKIYDEMKTICNELGLTFNEKKTRIVTASKGFVFLKVKYNVLSNGKIVKRLTRPGIVRMRRKLKKFKKRVNEGKMTYDDVFNSFQSWISHAKVAMSYKTRRSMLKLYNELFDGYKITKKYEHVKEVKHNAILQIDRWAKYRWCCNVA